MRVHAAAVLETLELKGADRRTSWFYSSLIFVAFSISQHGRSHPQEPGMGQLVEERRPVDGAGLRRRDRYAAGFARFDGFSSSVSQVWAGARVRGSDPDYVIHRGTTPRFALAEFPQGASLEGLKPLPAGRMD